jgi:hypothetical protein
VTPTDRDAGEKQFTGVSDAVKDAAAPPACSVSAPGVTAGVKSGFVTVTARDAIRLTPSEASATVSVIVCGPGLAPDAATENGIVCAGGSGGETSGEGVIERPVTGEREREGVPAYPVSGVMVTLLAADGPPLQTVRDDGESETETSGFWTTTEIGKVFVSNDDIPVRTPEYVPAEVLAAAEKGNVTGPYPLGAVREPPVEMLAGRPEKEYVRVPESPGSATVKTVTVCVPMPAVSAAGLGDAVAAKDGVRTVSVTETSEGPSPPGGAGSESVTVLAPGEAAAAAVNRKLVVEEVEPERYVYVTEAGVVVTPAGSPETPRVAVPLPVAAGYEMPTLTSPLVWVG